MIYEDRPRARRKAYVEAIGHAGVPLSPEEPDALADAVRLLRRASVQRNLDGRDWAELDEVLRRLDALGTS